MGCWDLSALRAPSALGLSSSLIKGCHAKYGCDQRAESQENRLLLKGLEPLFKELREVNLKPLGRLKIRSRLALRVASG